MGDLWLLGLLRARNSGIFIRIITIIFYVAIDGFLDRFLKGGVTTPNPRTGAGAARVQTQGRSAAMHSVLAAMPPVGKWLFKRFFIIKMGFIFP